MHFRWYLGLYFGFLLRKLFRMVFVMHFRFLDAEKKKKLRQGVNPLPYDLDFSYSLVCGYIWSCILLLHIHKTVEWIKLMFHPTKQVSSGIGVFVHHLVETLCAPVLIFVKAVFMAQVLVSVNVPHVSIFWWNVIFLKKYRQNVLGESLVNTLFHVSDEEFIN